MSNMTPDEHNGKKFKFTANKRSRPSVPKKSSDSKYGVFRCAIKWLVAFMLYLSVLTCLVTSKICWLVLGKQLKGFNESTANSTLAAEYSSEINKQALFFMLVLALMIPEAACFIHASLTSLAKKHQPWPTKRASMLVSFYFSSSRYKACIRGLHMPTCLSANMQLYKSLPELMKARS